MSKQRRIMNRKSSALLAAGTGALVCLTGSGLAHAVNGSVAGSNGTSVFGPSTGLIAGPYIFKLFGSKLNVSLDSVTYLGPFGTARGYLRIGPGTAAFNTYTSFTMPYISPHPAGVVVDSGLTFNAFGAGFIPFPTDTYFAVRFPDIGTRYGWVHLVTWANKGRQVTLDVWSYNGTGGSIKTLSDSVTTNRLALSDGQERLHWSNDNEAGIARYEVQTKDGAGNWTTTESEVPGSGTYSLNVAKGATCRLVVEMTDGSTKEVDF